MKGECKVFSLRKANATKARPLANCWDGNGAY